MKSRPLQKYLCDYLKSQGLKIKAVPRLCEKRGFKIPLRSCYSIFHHGATPRARVWEILSKGLDLNLEVANLAYQEQRAIDRKLKPVKEKTDPSSMVLSARERRLIKYARRVEHRVLVSAMILLKYAKEKS